MKLDPRRWWGSVFTKGGRKIPGKVKQAVPPGRDTKSGSGSRTGLFDETSQEGSAELARRIAAG